MNEAQESFVFEHSVDSPVRTHIRRELGGVANCLLPKMKKRKRISLGKKEMTRVTTGPLLSEIDARLRERMTPISRNISN